MTSIFIDTSSGSSGIAIMPTTSDKAIDLAQIMQEFIMDGVISTGWFDADLETQTQAEIEFREQERMFHEIPPLFLEQYRSRFVASSNGRIVDSDDDFVVLTHRFFETHGDVPVYITMIGHDDGIVIDTPFFD